jgi:hypothetical protein
MKTATRSGPHHRGRRPATGLQDWHQPRAGEGARLGRPHSRRCHRPRACALMIGAHATDETGDRRTHRRADRPACHRIWIVPSDEAVPRCRMKKCRRDPASISPWMKEPEPAMKSCPHKIGAEDKAHEQRAGATTLPLSQSVPSLGSASAPLPGSARPSAPSGISLSPI